MATTEEIQKLALHWSEVIQNHMESTHGIRLFFVPKGDPDSIVTLLANWGQIDPPGYAAPTEAQLLTALAVVEAQVAADDATDLIEAESEAGFNSIPNWATWTAAETEDWIEINVTDLASAKIALKKIAIAVMWLADKNFPNRR